MSERSESQNALAEHAKAELRKEQKNTDTEMAHVNADDVLVRLLIELGFEDVTEEFVKIAKWFA